MAQRVKVVAVHNVGRKGSLPPLPPKQNPDLVRLVCVSDTHSAHSSLSVPPDADLLVHAGDLTNYGSEEEVNQVVDWFNSLKVPKLVIAGNHCFSFDLPYFDKAWSFYTSTKFDAAALKDKFKTSCHYIENESFHFKGIHFYGSPCNISVQAFGAPRGSDRIKQNWAQIPEGVEVLLTHSPPFDAGAETLGGRDVGCVDLREVVDQRKPALHVFGHVHEGYGVKKSKDGSIVFVNCAVPGNGNSPIVVDLEVSPLLTSQAPI